MAPQSSDATARSEDTGSLRVLNLGCGVRTSPAAVNVDWSIYLRIHRSRLGRRLAPVVLRGRRRQLFETMQGDVVVHDLRKGIPARTGTIDAVYHSHVLDHLDRDVVPAFMAEIWRVLKPGGLHRMVVSDFGRAARQYLRSLEEGRPNHDEMFVPLLAMSVQREARGTSLQSPLLRRLENLVLGDARKRGQTHQWRYDRVNLRQIVEANGFVDFALRDYNDSEIPNWAAIGLEVEPDGGPYKPGSIWAEARKPPHAGVD